MSIVSSFHRFRGVNRSWFHRFRGVNDFMVSYVARCQWFRGFIGFVVSMVSWWES